MSTLTIVTTNPNKQRLAKAIFAESDFMVEFVALETPEIQAFTCEEVAIASAQFAYRELQRPVAVTDAGYAIPALNGFPGPFLKYINTMLSAEDILQMMVGKTDRRINLIEVVVYADGQHPPITCSSVIEGTLATETHGDGRIFDQLFIPNGFSQTASELGAQKMTDIYLDTFTHWRNLKKYLLENKKIPSVI